MNDETRMTNVEGGHRRALASSLGVGRWALGVGRLLFKLSVRFPTLSACRLARRPRTLSVVGRFVTFASFGVRRLTFGVQRFLPILLFLLLVIVSSSRAQTITLSSGQKIETQGLRRDGDVIMGKVQVGTGSGEVGYHLAQIAKVEFPEPRALKAASEFLVQGQPDKALAEINPVVAYYGPFKDVPGNWWAQAAL